MTTAQMVLAIVLIVVGLMNSLLLFINISMYKDFNALKLLVNQIYNASSAMAAKLHTQEIYLNKFGSSFTEVTNTMSDFIDRLGNVVAGQSGVNPRFGMIYKTVDGKYAASSLEGLIDKIKDDGTEKNYLSDEELENLRKLFNEEIGMDDFNDEEDDDGFNPNKGKF